MDVPANPNAGDAENHDVPYVVVLKGTSSVRLPHGRGARIALEGPKGEIEAHILTRWVDAGFDHPLPRELWIDVRLPESTIDAALEQASAVANALVPIVAFAANARIGAVEPHLAFESTEGVDERELVEYFVPDERGLLPQSREVDPDVFVATADAVFSSSQSKAVSTALAHYHAALGNYRLGGESLTVGHLFMAAEALRDASLAAYCREHGRSESEIMSAEGHENRNHLLAWARRELIFAGDLETYVAAKDASDALEHGYKTIGEVRALATAACAGTFQHIRRTIVELLDLDASTTEALVDAFGRPITDATSIVLRKVIRDPVIRG